MKTFKMVIIAVAIATVMSCGNKQPKNQVTETPLSEDLFLLTAPDGGLGVKNKEGTIILNTDVANKQISLWEGYLLVDYSATYPFEVQEKKLFDSVTGTEVLGGDEIKVEGNHFVGTRSDAVSRIFFPNEKGCFAANCYAADDKVILTDYAGELGIFGHDRSEILPQTKEYDRIALIHGTNEAIVFTDKVWGKGVLKDKAFIPGKSLSAKDLSVLKNRKGWSDTASVMILY